jgi:hypothetical protein
MCFIDTIHSTMSDNSEARLDLKLNHNAGQTLAGCSQDLWGLVNALHKTEIAATARRISSHFTSFGQAMKDARNEEREKRNPLIGWVVAVRYPPGVSYTGCGKEQCPSP